MFKGDCGIGVPGSRVKADSPPVATANVCADEPGSNVRSGMHPRRRARASLTARTYGTKQTSVAHVPRRSVSIRPRPPGPERKRFTDRSAISPSLRTGASRKVRGRSQREH
jgi:hypothetical protein